VNAGLPLGVLVGFVGGAAFIFFTLAALEGAALKAATSLPAMPASWFGGGWLTTHFDVDEILSWYVSSLAVTTLAISVYPLFKLIVWIGRRLTPA
jgi:hypothetical protein